jgi:hypothetical protein
MPTYAFRCGQCARTLEVFRTIGEHVANPRPLVCCGEAADRYFPPTGGNALDNVLAGDRQYEGMVATDGTDIGSRTKHRAYMRQHGLTTVDDFKETWKKAEQERVAYRTGKAGGAVSRDDLAREWQRRYG